MSGMVRWMVWPLQRLIAIFGLRVVRANVYETIITKNRALARTCQATLARNQALEAQMAGVLPVMEQDNAKNRDLAGAYEATLARNQALEAQIAGFLHVMEQDYRLIHDLFHADPRLQIDD